MFTVQLDHLLSSVRGRLPLWRGEALADLPGRYFGARSAAELGGYASAPGYLVAGGRAPFASSSAASSSSGSGTGGPMAPIASK